MTLYYSINLYFPREQCEPVLRSVAGMAWENDSDSVELKSVCALPNDSVIHLPFPRSHLSNSEDLSAASRELALDVTLLFPIDNFLLAYVKIGDSQLTRDRRSAFIGRLWLTITVATNFAEFSFEACTSDMSRLMITSSSVRQTFLELLATHSGLFGLIDTEGPGDPSLKLSSPRETLNINRLGYGADPPHDIDAFVARVREGGEPASVIESPMVSSVYDDAVKHLELYWNAKDRN